MTWLRSTLRDTRGSILVFSLVLVGVLTLLGIALFGLGVVENTLVVASEDEARAFYTAEAGLYRAELDLSNGTGSLFNTVFTGGVTVTLYNGQSFTQGGAGSNYVVGAVPVVASNPNLVTIRSTGCASATSPCPDNRAQKTVQAQLTRGTSLPGFVGLDSVTLGAINGLADSFDSTQGAYNPLTAGSLAKVKSNGPMTLHGETVEGSLLSTAGSVSLNSNAVVTGDVTAGSTVSNSGTVTGTITANHPTPAIVAPPVPACGPPYSSGSGISGTYSYNPATGVFKATGGVVTLAPGPPYCFSSFSLLATATVVVNGPVVVSMTGQLSASGGGFVNLTNVPANLQIISSYSGHNGVSLSGGAQAYMTVYAPTTDVSVSGGAPMFGAIVGQSLTTTGNSSIHYDVSLEGMSNLAGGVQKFYLISWGECKNPSCS